jgi:hypothetical protein
MCGRVEFVLHGRYSNDMYRCKTKQSFSSDLHLAWKTISIIEHIALNLLNNSGITIAINRSIIMNQKLVSIHESVKLLIQKQRNPFRLVKRVLNQNSCNGSYSETHQIGKVLSETTQRTSSFLKEHSKERDVAIGCRRIPLGA